MTTIRGRPLILWARVGARGSDELLSHDSFIVLPSSARTGTHRARRTAVVQIKRFIAPPMYSLSAQKVNEALLGLVYFFVYRCDYSSSIGANKG